MLTNRVGIDVNLKSLKYEACIDEEMNCKMQTCKEI